MMNNGTWNWTRCHDNPSDFLFVNANAKKVKRFFNEEKKWEEKTNTRNGL